jgi:NhaP-type Na+/H+ or K+/H+ antiporter
MEAENIITYWFIIAGALLIFMALAGSVLKRLPLTTAMVYLAIGAGASALGLLEVDLLTDSTLVERVSEVAVIVSLFTAGLKLRVPLREGRWRLPVRLAFGSMIVTVGLIAAVGVLLLNLPLGAAILLGAILAPTDPVLASDVQVEHPGDRDRLRFGLTGEAGLNDGTAFPFVMLGLGLLGLHEVGGHSGASASFLVRWAALDVVWSIAAGLGSGWLLGILVGRLVLYLRREHKEAVGLDDFLALGLIALSYGAALLIHSYGFLAVFAAGLALRRIEMRANDDQELEDMADEAKVPPAAAMTEQADEVATDPQKAPAFMAKAVLDFNEQLERLGMVTVTVLLGAMLSWRLLPAEALWFVPLLFLVIRPIAVWLGLIGARTVGTQRGMIAWFGVRGVGSVYYLAYAISHGLSGELAERLIALTLSTIVVSVIVHGISVTPLMKLYESRRSHRDGSSPSAAPAKREA